MNAGRTQRRAAKTAAESIAASSSGKPAARKTSSRDAKTAASKRIGKQAEDEQALCANEFGPDEDAAFKSDAASKKRELEPKRLTTGEKKFAHDAYLANPAVSDEPIVTDTSKIPKFRKDFKSQTDKNFDNLPDDEKKSVGRTECNHYLITDAKNPEMYLDVAVTIDGPNGIRTKLGGRTGQYYFTVLTERKIIRGVGVEPFYGSRTELEEIRAKVIAGGPAKVRACRDRANEDLPTNSKGNCTGSGRPGNAPTDYFIAYSATATGEKNANVILVKQKGLGKLTLTPSKGGVGMRVSRGRKGKQIKLDLFQPVDPLKPKGVKFLVVRGIFYVEMHTSEPKDWGKAINAAKLQEAIDAM